MFVATVGAPPPLVEFSCDAADVVVGQLFVEFVVVVVVVLWLVTEVLSDLFVLLVLVLVLLELEAVSVGGEDDSISEMVAVSPVEPTDSMLFCYTRFDATTIDSWMLVSVGVFFFSLSFSFAQTRNISHLRIGVLDIELVYGWHIIDGSKNIIVRLAEQICSGEDK